MRYIAKLRHFTVESGLCEILTVAKTLNERQFYEREIRSYEGFGV